MGKPEDIEQRDWDAAVQAVGTRIYLIPIYSREPFVLDIARAIATARDEGRAEQRPKTFCAMLTTGACDVTDRAEAAEARALAAEQRIQMLEGHVEQLIGLLELIKEHWIDYDHVFSISVHEALAAIRKGEP